MTTIFKSVPKTKKIPKDTPKYLRKVLERAIKEYQEGVILEKSALYNFAEKYVIEGKLGITPKQFFKEKAFLEIIETQKSRWLWFVLWSTKKNRKQNNCTVL